MTRCIGDEDDAPVRRPDLGRNIGVVEDDLDEELAQDHLLCVHDEHAAPELFPRLSNISAGMLYEAVLRAEAPDPPEYVTVPSAAIERIETSVKVAEWNMMWEAAQFRRRLYDDEDLPEPLRRIADRGDHNVVFVPRTATRYYELAPLVHLLDQKMLKRFGLPLLRGGKWPFLVDTGPIDRVLPSDFAERLSRAWASRVWSSLCPQSPIRAFTDRDPIRLLAHNLDFWLPPVTKVIQDRLRDFPVVDNGVDEQLVALEDGTVLPARRANPRMGGDIWTGEHDAALAVDEVVEAADGGGRLRSVLDTVRPHRVEDDFSSIWSRSREDFERRLHHTRARVSVRFVELPDTVPVQGPETEVVGNQVCADFLTLLDPVDRQVVVLLTRGATTLTEVAELLGYRNHSAISKRLARIAGQALHFFENY